MIGFECLRKLRLKSIYIYKKKNVCLILFVSYSESSIYRKDISLHYMSLSIKKSILFRFAESG